MFIGKELIVNGFKKNFSNWDYHFGFEMKCVQINYYSNSLCVCVCEWSVWWNSYSVCRCLFLSCFYYFTFNLCPNINWIINNEWMNDDKINISIQQQHFRMTILYIFIHCTYLCGLYGHRANWLMFFVLCFFFILCNMPRWIAPSFLFFSFIYHHHLSRIDWFDSTDKNWMNSNEMIDLKQTVVVVAVVNVLCPSVIIMETFSFKLLKGQVWNGYKNNLLQIVVFLEKGEFWMFVWMCKTTTTKNIYLFYSLMCAFTSLTTIIIWSKKRCNKIFKLNIAAKHLSSRKKGIELNLSTNKFNRLFFYFLSLSLWLIILDLFYLKFFVSWN